MSLKAALRDSGGVTVIELNGRMTLGSGESVQKIVTSLAEQGRRHVLVNLENVPYADSAGIGDLLGGYAAIANRGGMLKLLRPHQRVKELLEMTQLHTVFEICDDEAAAVLSFGPAAAPRLRQNGA